MQHFPSIIKWHKKEAESQKQALLIYILQVLFVKYNRCNCLLSIS